MELRQGKCSVIASLKNKYGKKEQNSEISGKAKLESCHFRWGVS